MEITQKLIDDIIFQVTEKVLLRMPEVIGNLQMNHAETNKMTKGFYKKYPDFKSDPLTVQSVVGQLEKENAGMLYEDILRKAAPMIKERMKTVSSLNITNKPERNKLDLNINLDSNGEI